MDKTHIVRLTEPERSTGSRPGTIAKASIDTGEKLPGAKTEKTIPMMEVSL